MQSTKAQHHWGYKAATNLWSRAHILTTGTTEERTLEELVSKEGGNFDIAKLYENSAKRQATKTVTTEEVAKATDPKDWYLSIRVKASEDYTHYDYENLNWVQLFSSWLCSDQSGLGSVLDQTDQYTGSDSKSQLIKILSWVVQWQTQSLLQIRLAPGSQGGLSNGNVMTGLS